MLSIYLDLPAWIRTIIAVVVLSGGIWMTIYGWRGRPTFQESYTPRGDRIVEMKGNKPYADMALYCGLAVTALGALLLGACGTSDSEKHGYKF